MLKKSWKFMQDYIHADSPTGWEEAGQKIWTKYLEEHGVRSYVDRKHNAFAHIGETGPVLAMAAHSDEIGFMVNHIDDHGFISIRRIGGMDVLSSLTHRVRILTNNGPVLGIIGIPAIHIRERDFVPKAHELFVDIGCCCKEEVLKKGIQIGNPILIDTELAILNNQFLCGKGIDDKIGGFIIAEVLREIQKEIENNPDGYNREFKNKTIMGINACQEEIGHKGSIMSAHKLKPDLVIVIEVTHETNHPQLDPLHPPVFHTQHGDINFNDGCTITISPMTDKRMNDFIIKKAKKNKIGIQLEAAGITTATDADGFSYAQDGIPTVLIGIPLRYMHTSVEMINLNNVKDCIRLLKIIYSSDISELL